MDYHLIGVKSHMMLIYQVDPYILGTNYSATELKYDILIQQTVFDSAFLQNVGLNVIKWKSLDISHRDLWTGYYNIMLSKRRHPWKSRET